MKRTPSIFGPLVLIALGALWLMSNLGVFPPGNFWAIFALWPVFIIAIGLGLILRQRWSFARNFVALLLVTGMVLAVVFAPQLGLASSSGRFSWFPNVQLSGNTITEERDVSGFDTISISYPAEVIIQQGTEEKLVIEGDESLIRYLRTNIKGKTLEIDSAPGIRFSFGIPGSLVRMTITVKDLEEIRFSSAGKIQLLGMETDSFTLKLSGAGEATLVDMVMTDFTCTISGAGRVKVDGEANKSIVNISGVGIYKGADLQSQSVEVHISGSGSADIWAIETLDAAISGAGSVNYYGSPTVTKSISGVGSIHQVSEK